MKIKYLEVGSTWFVQLAPRATLVKRKIVDVTKETVLLKNEHTNSSYNESRYKFTDIEFVEEYLECN